MYRQTIISVMVAVCTLFASWPTQAENLVLRPKKTPRIKRLQTYSMQNRPTEAVQGSSRSTMPRNRPRPRSLGSATAPRGISPGPGVEVSFSWDDWLFDIKGRHVDFRGTPAVHFSYTEHPDLSVNEAYGYNAYDPISGSWPRGQDIGCRVQATDDVGYNVSMDVTPDGRVVLGGVDSYPAISSGVDNHFYYQGAPFACNWFSGTWIDSAQYWNGMVNPSSSTYLSNPLVEVQVIGTDTITHVLASQSDQLYVINAPEVKEQVIQYYNKLGSNQSGSWNGPLVIDTANWFGYHLTVSRVSGKVAAIYLHHTPEAIAHDEPNDHDVYYRESADGGFSWGPPVNVTNYDRSQPTYSPWLEVHGLYDSEDYLHIAYNAFPVPANPYDLFRVPPFDWNSLLNGSSIFHWSQRYPGYVSRVFRAEWDEDWMQTQLCGFLGWNALTTAFINISECSGRLYVIWAMANDGNAEPPIGDDCTDGPVPDWRFAGNGELYMSVSNSLDGILWDKYRNLTNSYSPGCDSLLGGGMCYNDARVTVSRYGMNTDVWGALTWPGTELVDPSGSYAGTNFLHVFWVEDHYPGNSNIYHEGFGYPPATVNSLRWMRLACVDPVFQGQIWVTPMRIGFPEYVKPGQTATDTIYLINDGNTAFSVEMNPVESTLIGYNWLSVTPTSLTVPAGWDPVRTFVINIDATGLSQGASLNGFVWVKSVTPGFNDSLAISITNYLVADTVVDVALDTVTTGCTQLAVANNGTMGGNADPYWGWKSSWGGAHLDHTSCGDCDPQADIYLYSGGPMLNQLYNISGPDSGFIFNTALYQNSLSFGRDWQIPSYSFIGPGGSDAYYSGIMLNEDGHMAMKRIYYAPPSANDTNFIIVCTKLFLPWNYSVEPAYHLSLGEIIDWDIPSSLRAINGSGTWPDLSAIYQYGTDTLGPFDTCRPSERYGAVALLGMYQTLDVGGQNNSCINDLSMQGGYIETLDSVLEYERRGGNEEAAYFWRNAEAHTGLSELPGSDDFLTVMTFKHDFTLTPSDTLFVYTVLTTAKPNDAGLPWDELRASIEAARHWYADYLRSGCSYSELYGYGCCQGITGNIDGDPDEIVDIGDLTALIAYLFLPPNTPPVCMEEGNVDGDPGGIVDIGDLTALIAFLFIPPNNPPAPCQ